MVDFSVFLINLFLVEMDNCETYNVPKFQRFLRVYNAFLMLFYLNIFFIYKSNFSNSETENLSKTVVYVFIVV